MSNYLTRKQVMRNLRVSLSFLVRLEKAGVLVGFRDIDPRGRVHYRREDVEKFLDSKEVR